MKSWKKYCIYGQSLQFKCNGSDSFIINVQNVVPLHVRLLSVAFSTRRQMNQWRTGAQCAKHQEGAFSAHRHCSHDVHKLAAVLFPDFIIQLGLNLGCWVTTNRDQWSRVSPASAARLFHEHDVQVHCVAETRTSHSQHFWWQEAFAVTAEHRSSIDRWPSLWDRWRSVLLHPFLRQQQIPWHSWWMLNVCAADGLSQCFVSWFWRGHRPCHSGSWMAVHQWIFFWSVNHMKFTAGSSYFFRSCLQRVRRAMRLASDNCCAWRRLRHFSWRCWWIILCTVERGMPVSYEIWRIDRCVFGLSSWLSTRFSTCLMFWLICAERGLPLTGCRSTVLVFWMFFSR